ncbi:hypothetical protein, partial [Pseudoalteromonas sp. Of11M-6]|uniref:hypothetical protein n=1 Tax=Pseudoalteromonas sp. Of11M-6 TaxID=2917754 RepID=UPI001EF5E1F6
MGEPPLTMLHCAYTVVGASLPREIFKSHIAKKPVALLQRVLMYMDVRMSMKFMDERFSSTSYL